MNLGSHQVLLTVNLDNQSPLAVAVRSDVDACIWQPQWISDDFVVEHRGTLLALGYIQVGSKSKIINTNVCITGFKATNEIFCVFPGLKLLCNMRINETYFHLLSKQEYWIR